MLKGLSSIGNPAKAQAAKIKLIDKNINHPHRIVFTDPVFQPVHPLKIPRATSSMARLRRHAV